MTTLKYHTNYFLATPLEIICCCCTRKQFPMCFGLQQYSCIFKMQCNFFCVVYNFRSLVQKHAPVGLWVLCGVRQGSLGFVTELLISDFGRAQRIRTVGAMIEWLVCMCISVCMCECIIWHFNVHRKYTIARKKTLYYCIPMSGNTSLIGRWPCKWNVWTESNSNKRARRRD